jgi:propionate CoA-transferase
MVHWSRKGIRCLPVVNYDDFMILTELLNDNSNIVRSLMERFYARVGRYSTSAFLHVKFGDALRQRDVSPTSTKAAGRSRGISAGLGIKERTVRNP